MTICYSATDMMLQPLSMCCHAELAAEPAMWRPPWLAEADGNRTHRPLLAGRWF